MKQGSKILISGAGVAGLTLAIRLGKAGFKPVIVEKSAGLRAGGYLVALSHQAYFFAQEMGLVPLLSNYNLNIAASSYHDKNGHALLQLDYERMFEGLGIIQIMRDDLVHVLYNQAKDFADIRFNDRITAIEQNEISADVLFSSGRRETFDVVIGCDGVHSAVRDLTFSPDEYNRVYLDLHCAAYLLPNIAGIRQKFETHMERDRYMAIFSTMSDQIAAVFVWHNENRSLPPPENRREHLLSAFRGTGTLTGKVLDYCPADEPFYMDVLSQIDMPVWHKHRSVLVGDAAHCLTLFSGRGAAAAFAGACRLSNALIAHDLPDAFLEYENEMRPIIADIMPATRGAVKWYVPRSMGHHLMRNGLMRFVPNFVFRQYFKRKYSKV